MAILLISNASGSVTATVNVSPAPVLPTAGRMTTPLPVTNLGECEDCGSDLAPLINNKGEVRTAFCEYCEFGF
ncbi:hypothetical protein OOK58_42555 [Streptomyces sp. NBC_01728]|uniref:hypothetical protein n=1 Tax=unclassified Streptomyces TaxID=2593676 RepID=UPI0022550B68|nr:MULTISPECIES: hypothetical protein [unclassified Streptomyces]MCX4458594.1 hypothetical protein [Streptomyces sp. NBC_01719]MCX4497951.1 hypothetical protein [Streptomyces sp. NBC_01728]